MILTDEQKRLADSITTNAERLGLPDLKVAAITREARDHLGAYSADRRWATLTCEWLHDDCERLTPPELRLAAAVMGTARNYDPKAQLLVLAAIDISLPRPAGRLASAPRLSDTARAMPQEDEKGAALTRRFQTR